jgi:hypothetical protein
VIKKKKKKRERRIFLKGYIVVDAETRPLPENSTVYVHP